MRRSAFMPTGIRSSLTRNAIARRLYAGKLAEELGVKNLILYHTEEKTLATRKENYTREAAENFKGRIFVPDDLEVIEL